MDDLALDHRTGGHAKIRIRSAGYSDVGRRRQQNEDSYLIRDDLGLYVVADGVGGSRTGEVASRMATLSMSNFFDATSGQGWSDNYRVLLDLVLEPSAQRLSAALRKANRDIYDIASSVVKHRGMSTTVVAAYVDRRSPRLHLGHVGDSRCYRIRCGEIRQMTRDHSLRNEALESFPVAKRHLLSRIKSNILTRAMGMEETVEIDISSHSLQVGDLLILCSDGLSTMCPESEILDAATGGSSVEEVAELLTWLANDAGGKDNITVVVMEVVGG